MARPEIGTIAAGLAAWDAQADQNFSIITESPFPMFQVALVGDLPAAASYDKCLVLVGTSDPRVYISLSSAWVLYDKIADYLAASSAVAVADLVTDYNNLRTNLIAGGLMATS